MTAKELISDRFGGQIRVRVCGIYELNGNILMINHNGINEKGDFWCTPGGGLEFGESIEEGLKREFLEETGLKIKVGRFLNIFEFIETPLHAIELFYSIEKIDGNLGLGYDPETGNKILKELKWMSIPEISKLKKEEIHQFFHKYLLEKHKI